VCYYVAVCCRDRLLLLTHCLFPLKLVLKKSADKINLAKRSNLLKKIVAYYC
jgi:hypothetical protein